MQSRFFSVVLFILAVSTIKLSLGLSSSTSNNNKPKLFEFTGIPRHVDWTEQSLPVPLESEIALQDSGVLIHRGEFGYLLEARVEEIRQACEPLGMSLEQGLSLRRQAMITKTIYSSGKLKRNGAKLSRLLEATSSKSNNNYILDLSHQFDQPPVSIMRAILDFRIRQSFVDDNMDDSDIKSIVKAIVDGELAEPHVDLFLSPLEKLELETARQSDVVGYATPSDSTLVLEAATSWEQMLYDYLNEHQINFVTEDELRNAGHTRTPDCLILDDVTINGHKVRWMDSKNFFGSGTAKHFLKNARKQIAKYEEEFGDTGAILYRHGYCSSLTESLSNTLMLDLGPLREPE